MMFINRLLTKSLQVFLVIALVIMLALVFLNVILRYFFDYGISISEEISRFLFVWVTFVGALLALINNEHLGIDMFTRRLSKRGQTICQIMSRAIMLAGSITFLIGSWRQMWINMPNEMPVTGMPVGMLYAAGVFSATAISILLVQRIIVLIASFK